MFRMRMPALVLCMVVYVTASDLLRTTMARPTIETWERVKALANENEGAVDAYPQPNHRVFPGNEQL